MFETKCRVKFNKIPYDYIFPCMEFKYSQKEYVNSVKVNILSTLKGRNIK